MKNTVLYIGKKQKEGAESVNDNVRTIASAIASGVHVSAYPVGEHTFVSDTGILFIGCNVRGEGKIPRALRKLLNGLTADAVKLVVVFSVIQKGTASALAPAKAILNSKGIKVCDEEYIYKESSGFRKKSIPTKQDEQSAKEFAANIAEKNRNLQH